MSETQLPPLDFNNNEFKNTIMDTVASIITDNFPQFKNPIKLVLVSLVGSQNYGTAKDNSDLDIRVVYSKIS